ncbi:hypothetical protein MNBD_GAMMA16-1997 [hydrothermal vent metagenome]|uniref:Uncharacterized protein n=1 Tax=hydrothermal vent metagenome TaxID=652676 RepID=A0A3B0ZEL8_9ZZZZ
MSSGSDLVCKQDNTYVIAITVILAIVGFVGISF